MDIADSYSMMIMEGTCGNALAAQIQSHGR